MADRWVINDDYPNGHLVPMTPAEEAQRNADQAVGAAAVEAAMQEAASLASRMDVLEQAQTDLASGAIFGWASTAERRALDALFAAARQVRA